MSIDVICLPHDVTFLHILECMYVCECLHTQEMYVLWPGT